jgi:hypothetical protein
VMETGKGLPAEFGPILRLTVLIPVGAVVFIGAIVLLDRKLVKNFLEFVQTAFERRTKKPEIP